MVGTLKEKLMKYFPKSIPNILNQFVLFNQNVITQKIQNVLPLIGNCVG